MWRSFSAGLAAAAFLWSMTSAEAGAAQLTVTQVDKNADGTMTYHFSIKIGQTEAMEDAGLTVVRFHHQDDWDRVLGRYPHVFGRPT